MTESFDDERVQFYLRHYQDIREWAAIGRDVIDATDALLEGLEDQVHQRLAGDDFATTRHDEGKYRRLLIRHRGWHQRLAIAAEWESGVDPFGPSLPKYGIFFMNPPAEFQPARGRIVDKAKNTLRGFRVPGDGVWPAVRWVPKSSTWWQDPDAWLGEFADDLAALWRAAAPMIDESLRVDRP